MTAVLPPTLSSPTLFAAAVLLVSATALTAFGLRQARPRGWGWWVAAPWITTAGVALAAFAAPAGLHALPGQEAALPAGQAGRALALAPLRDALSAALLAAWPVLALVGLRRFLPRQPLPGSERVDWAVLGGALAGILAVGAGSSTPTAATSAAVAGLAAVPHLYAALLLFNGPGGREATPVLGLATAIALVALVPALAALTTLAAIGSPAWLAAPSLQARALAATLGLVVLAVVTITLVCERTERQLRDSRRRLRALANLDALTEVPNRRHFHELAAQALRQDAPGNAMLLLFDIDHFKLINDRLGHAAGDRALTTVAGAVLEELRAQDIVGRHGGDEFTLLLRGAGRAHAMAVAERISASVQQRALAAQLPALSLSFGLVQPAEGERVGDALRRADQALYEAKRQGRSRAVAASGNEAQPVFAESRRLDLTPC